MKRVIIIVSAILCTAVIGGALLVNSMLGQIKRNTMPKDNDSLGITPPTVTGEDKKKKDIINIALFGFDASYERTDSIMVVTVDRVNKNIKLTSLLRDMYIDIPGHDKGLLNHAFLKGGAELAIKTINTNFGLDIEDYAAVNFDGFIKLIDAVGGVEVKVSQAEIPIINSATGNKINAPGLQKLNGAQAKAYAGIRVIGRDFERTARQREILNGVYKNIKKQGLIKLPQTIASILPFVETSLDNNEIVDLTTILSGINADKIEEFRVPIDGLYKNERVGTWYTLSIDLEETKKRLHAFIYE